MEKKERYKRLLIFGLSALEIIVLTGFFAAMWFLCFADNRQALHQVFMKGNYVVIGIHALLLILFFRIFDGFKIGYLRIYEVLFSQILSVVCVNAVSYLQLCLIGRWRFLQHIGPTLILTVADLLFVLVCVIATRWIYLRLYPSRKMVLVYGKYDPKMLIHKIAGRGDKYSIREAVSYTEGYEKIIGKIEQYGCVMLMDIPCSIRNKILKYCFYHNIRVYTVPKISDIMIMSATDIHLFDTSLLLMRNKDLSIEQAFLKRAFDIVMSVLALIIASPFFLIIALCVKGYDGGPVFFRQERLTKDGKVFKVYKFRSMRVENEKKEYCLTRKNDDRITPVGKILRNIHFDELPQLINILKGEMSFVGPRPECPGLAAEYKESIPEFDFRLKMKAGLTGFAQVYGKYNTTPYDKLKLDLTYIENYSFLLDLKLLILTFKILFQKENTEGIEQWQTTAAVENKLDASEEIKV